jgi:hypothetical protein
MPSTTIEISREQRQPLHRLVTQHIGRVHELDGTCFDIGLVREFLAMLLADPASADQVVEAVERAGGLEVPPPRIAEGLRSAATGFLRAASEEDWTVVADQLIAQARESTGRAGSAFMTCTASAMRRRTRSARPANFRSATMERVARPARPVNSRSL